MTTEAAEAMKEAARYTYAVPAQERTNQVRQESRRLYVTAIVVFICAFLIYFKPEAGWPIATLAGVLGAYGTLSSLLSRKSANMRQ